MSIKEKVTMYKKETFESEEGDVFIDVHRPIKKMGDEKTPHSYGQPQFFGRANVMMGGHVQVFKFEIPAKTLAEAVNKFEAESEKAYETLEKEYQKGQNKIIAPE